MQYSTLSRRRHIKVVAAESARRVLRVLMRKRFGMSLQEQRAQESWKQLANCVGRDPDLFFPERGAHTAEAKRVCHECVVREQCLEYALDNGEKFGIWGGLSERERRRVRRERARARRRAVLAKGTKSRQPSS